MIVSSQTEGATTVFLSGTYSTSGTTLSLFPTCFCSLRGPLSGCSATLQPQSVPYTATETQIETFVSVGVECGLAVLVLTKQ
jgi:hypothetical protein